MVDLGKDFATINKTVGEAGCIFSGLTYEELKDSSRMMEIHVQILHCTDLGQQFDPNALVFYESIPVVTLADLLPQLCASCGDALQPGERHPRAEDSTGVPPLVK